MQHHRETGATNMKIHASRGVLIIANAIVWGVVMIGCSWKLSDTGMYDDIQNILVGGSGITTILIMGSAIQFKGKQNEDEKGGASAADSGDGD